LISSHDRHEDFTFSEVTQLIRLFLENNQYIKDNLVLLHPFLSDPYFSYCIKNKLHEYVDSFSIVFLAAYLKYDSQEEASAFFFTLISLMKEHEYLLDRFIFFARDSLYKFLKMNHLEDIILNYIKKTEEKRLVYINTIESKIVAIQQKIILQKKSLETFLSSIKIKNDAVARLQETIKIHLKKGLDHENYIVLKAEKEIESFMREILNFENRIKQVEEVIKTLHEEIVTYQAEIEKTKKEIALFPDLFKIATDIIAHGEGIHEEKN
jgi:hypothetical protein